MAREARFNRDYKTSLELIMEVIVSEPNHQEARGLLREVASELARLETQRVQAERRALLAEAKAKRERIRARLAREAAWETRLKDHLGRSEFLEAYDFLYGLKDQSPEDPWPQLKIDGLTEALTVKRENPVSRDGRYQAALRGFLHFSRIRWDQARASWRKALGIQGSRIPEERIRNYLAWLDQKYPEPPPATAATVRPAEKPRAAPMAPPPAPALEPKKAAVAAFKPAPPVKLKEIEQRYQKALAAYRRGEARTAMAALERILRLAPDHKRAWDLLETIKTALARDHYIVGLMRYGQGKIPEAIREWREGLKLKPSDEKCQRALERAQKDLEELRK